MMLLTALIWGLAFIAQSVGMEHIGPFTFNGVRSIVAGVALLPAIPFFRKGRRRSPGETKKTWQGGLICGTVLFLGSTLQQIGILHTTVGKTSFITALYIVIVPVCGLFLRKSVRPLVWLAVVIAAVGLFLLCIPAGGGGLALNRGDLYVLCCAVMFAAHIWAIDFFSPRVDGVMMSAIQFFVVAILSAICAFLFETPRIGDVIAGWMPLLYAGLLSSGVGYTLQIIAQRHTSPTVASLLLSLESVFGALFGVLLLSEGFSARELSGMALMFIAIIFAQLPAKAKFAIKKGA